MADRKQIASAERFNNGKECMDKGDYTEAVHCFSDAIDYDPGNAVFYAYRSSAHLAMDEYTLALKDAEAAAKMEPGKPAPHVALSQCQLVMGNSKAALDSANKAVGISKSNIEALLAKMMALHAQGSYEEALAIGMEIEHQGVRYHDVQAASTIAKASLDVMKKKGNGAKADSALLKLFDVKDPKAELRTPPEAIAQVKHTQHIRNLLVEGQKMFARGNAESAIEAWRNAMTLAVIGKRPLLANEAREKLSRAYRSIGRDDLSMEIVSVGSGGDTQALLAQAASYFSSKNYEKAYALFEEVLEIEKKNKEELTPIAVAQNNLGCTAFAMGKTEKAMKHFEEAAKIYEEDCDVYGTVLSLNNQSRCQLKGKNLKEARETLAGALQLHPQLYDRAQRGRRTEGEYTELFIGTYSLITEVYLAAGKVEAAFEFAERTKGFAYMDQYSAFLASKKDQDCTADMIIEFAMKTEACVVSYYFSQSDTLHAFCVTPSDGEVHHIEIPQFPKIDIISFLEDAVLDEREHLDLDGDPEEYVQASSSVALVNWYNALIKPLEPFWKKACEDEGAPWPTKFVFSPHRELFSLAFNTLLSAEHCAHLGSKSIVSVSSCAADWVHCCRTEEKLSKPGIAYTYHVYDSTLPGAQDLDSAAKEGGGDPVVSHNASKEGFKGIKASGALKAGLKGFVQISARFASRNLLPKSEAKVIDKGASAKRKKMTAVRAGSLEEDPQFAVSAIADDRIRRIFPEGSPEGWLIFSKDGATPFAPTDDVALAEAGRCLPVSLLSQMLKSSKVQCENAVVFLNLYSRDDDGLGDWRVICREILALGAVAVIVPQFPTTNKECRTGYVKKLLTELKSSGNVLRAHQKAVDHVAHNCTENLLEWSSFLLFQ